MYRAGIWSAILLGLAFLGIYAWRVTEEARQLAQAWPRPSSCSPASSICRSSTGCAAAAARAGHAARHHRARGQGTAPDRPKGRLVGEDIVFLREEVDRCRGILGKLTSLGDGPGPLDTMRSAC